MPVSSIPHNDQPSATRAAPGRDIAVELLPLPDESPADYLARLEALHARVGALIGAIETRRPVLGPPPAAVERANRAAERRAVSTERRAALLDRRVGMADARPVPINRRFGARDRRRLPVERREDFSDRRRDPSPVPWQGRFRLDRTAAMWTLQILAWAAVVATVLIFGIR
ncbi:MAG: hypothetical protein ACJ762_00900 [Solirubrobacteraceae bacterium]